ncbi:MAG: alpha-amylase family glycosyl hydrolase [Anaerolineales bacterium]
MQIITRFPSFITGRYQFHISKPARDRYQFKEEIFAISGNVILGDFRSVRKFTQKVNANKPADAPFLLASDVNAMGLIDEILHLIVGLYKKQINPKTVDEALQWLNTRLGKDAVEEALRSFNQHFPAIEVYTREQTAEDYLSGHTGGVPNKEIILEEMMLLWIANLNPAFNPFLFLFDDTRLKNDCAYEQITDQLDQFFNYQPTFGPNNQQLIEMLRAPAIASPNSLSGQLEYIRTHWAGLLGDMLIRLLSSMDLIAEEHKAIFGGHSPAEVIDFNAWGLGDAPERFSADSDWMPRLVLLAKNAYVWLDQLSEQYHRDISRLDQIPDEELDRLAAQGITGLWLIGLWRRGDASRKIKQMMGDPDAIASAYSLDDYIIDDQLGGPQASENLRQRAIRRGIRLGGDMVPNHMAIDSRWVMEHPHWFLSLDHSPFPNYSFIGPNLSPREGIGIYLEDHYYSRSDAAVIFKRVDFHTGEERYIYHGNDGTNMPWNDTAQLNFTLPEVREGVIQTILHVARQFPIIRFDAAMTLAKQHIQRLWFPPPGSGGAIPSRAGHGMTTEEFDKAIPKEFWREVVDRVAAEVPDTLLLAEAFWMMEGYFVRTLGMHRVYNSAFMHMLRDEENDKYRLLIKETLEYNPQILKRYVNFMNNPDEETAVEQFGKGDKYFGVATMMATLPGLPMVGHGQIEGFSEKYGMEYHRAKWNERPDQDLISRHGRQIFPLFHRRRLFAEVKNFRLYDFYTASGYVNEDVFAYSNRMGDQRALVIYHNRFGDTRGWIKNSAAFLTENASGERVLTQTTLGAGLDIPNDHNSYLIFRDLTTGMEYIRNCAELHNKGLFLELFAYHAYVFLDFRIVHDATDGRYARVNAYLGGKPVPSIDEALQEMFLQIIHHPYRELVNAGMLNYLINAVRHTADAEVDPVALEQVEQKSLSLLRAVANFLDTHVEIEPITADIRKRVDAILNLSLLEENYPYPRSTKYQKMIRRLGSRLDDDPFNWAIMLITEMTGTLGQVLAPNTPVDAALISQDWVDEWLLRKVIREELGSFTSLAGAEYGLQLVRLLIGQQGWMQIKASKANKPSAVLDSWLEDPAIASFLNINTYNNIEWFNAEAMHNWLWWMQTLAILDILADASIPDKNKPKIILESYDVLDKIANAVSQSEFQVEILQRLVKGTK